LRCLLALIMLSGFMVPAGLYAAGPLVIDGSVGSLSPGQRMELLEDPGRMLSVTDVMSPEYSGKFRQCRSDVPNLGYTRSAWWFRFVLKNPTGETVSPVLEIEYPLIDEIEIYVPRIYGNTAMKRGGRLVPFSQKEEDYRGYVFHIEAPPRSETVYYIRVASEDSIAFPLMVLSERAFRKKDHIGQFVFGVYYGFIIVMILYNLLIFIATRDINYFYLILSLITMELMFKFSLNGFAFEFINGRSLWWARESIAFFMTVSMICTMQFARSLLKLRENTPLLDRAMVIIMVMEGAIAAGSFIAPYHYIIQATVFVSMAGAAVMWISGFLCLIRGYKAARFYLAAWSAVQVGGLLYALKVLGLIPSNFFTEYSWQMGCGALAFLLSLSLADMINIMKREKFNAQIEALKLKDEMNVRLEEQVNERTMELQAAMEELQAANEQIVEARDALWGEMELAKKIQTILLPRNPAIDGYELSAYMSPTERVGGDYYDVINAAGHDWIVIGDVSGHGVPAGLVMMMTQTSIHAVLDPNPDMNPSELLETINRTITGNIRLLDEDKYMTITVMACHRNGLFYFSGLHQDIMLYRDMTGSVELVKTDGIWLGLPERPGPLGDDHRLTINIGDSMLLYTDGITEAWANGSVKDHREPEKDMYGVEKLEETFRSLGGRSTRDIQKGILHSLKDYQCHDDVTFLVIRRLN